MFSIIWLYSLPLIVIFLFYFWKRASGHKNSQLVYDEAVASGMTEPASMHPVINHALCLGCASCVNACPEKNKNVLGVIKGKAHLINPTHCIGHGACKTACPFDAIELVFGTEKRGIDIPEVDETFQSNVPGIFISGELGGMGLIRNAVTQGVQAVDSIRKLDGTGSAQQLDLVIVGAGPSGIAAALSAMSHKLKFVILEQDSLGGTVSHYPRGKIVMTAPVDLPMIGKMQFKETTKEALMAFWEDVVKKTGLKINDRARVESISSEGNGFLVKTATEEYRSRAILLAIGRRGTPRKLGVPGEEQTKVVYRLIDPEQYRNQHVLIVGGGDSALEAAVSISEEAGTTVTIAYRSAAFSRAKEKNRNKISEAEKSGKIQVLMNSTVKQIESHKVVINTENDELCIENDAVIVCAGGILPTAFLKDSGIDVVTKYGTA
ncbi:MAG: 4Fe-4S ferredoxin [endosymbiont of Galathealinum brachiosum]|uniref:4Fe-4S ferredoxin n=1 Tax=endosymbiont of Galathealinum brachiosum TaxID=2200906 RepID=A0A370DLE6_9GAMM|nr:MAG: 4Fe-4S ferredoxin [endosymbiont of Galathealinum brachiosum]